MARYQIRDADGAVLNIIEWDGQSEYDPGDGLSLHLLEDVVQEAPSADLQQIRLAATMAVNDATEAARTRIAPYLKYIDTEYQVLAAQADAYVMAGRPEFPVGLEMLVQSAADSGKSVSDEADSIRTKRDQYIVLLNVTRSLRRQGASAIEAAGDAESINSVRDLYVGQLASL